MTHDFPSEGGSYIRHPDGRLERIEEETPEVPLASVDAAAAPEKPAGKSAVNTPIKPTVKEG